MEERPNHLAVWAGVATLFTNLAAINIVVWLGDEKDERVQAIAALVTAFMVAASVYARQKFADAKAERQIQEKKEIDK